MRGQRITSVDGAARGGRPAPARLVARAARTGAGRTRSWIAAVLAAGLLAASLTLPRPSGAAERQVEEGAAPPDASGPAQEPLGRADGLLVRQNAGSRGRSGRVHGPMPGCTAMATLDGVSAALQSGPFGRGSGLAIMQFRNVVTDSAQDGEVACHSDVLLSDGSLHRADYGLHRAKGGTRLHIEVARDRTETTAGGGSPAPGGPLPAAPDDSAPGEAAPAGQPVPHLPAT